MKNNWNIKRNRRGGEDEREKGRDQEKREGRIKGYIYAMLSATT